MLTFKKNNLSLFIFFVYLLLSCKKSDLTSCITSFGKIIKQERLLIESFNTIDVNHNLEITLFCSPISKIEIETGKNIINNISTDIKAGKLIISNNNSCNWIRSYNKPINIFIYHPNLIEIYNNGSGGITNEGVLDFDSLRIHQNGSGNINLKIKTRKVYTILNGIGDVTLSGSSNYAYGHTFNYGQVNFGRLNTINLKSKIFEISCFGQSDVHIYADSVLRGILNNIGNVHYYGSPKVKILTDEGKGEFIER